MICGAIFVLAGAIIFGSSVSGPGPGSTEEAGFALAIGVVGPAASLVDYTGSCFSDGRRPVKKASDAAG